LAQHNPAEADRPDKVGFTKGSTMKKPNPLILTAWVVHVVAWFLPAIKAHDFQPPLPGWKAFRLASCAILPCEGIEFEKPYQAVLSAVSVVTTLFFVLWSPWAVLRGSRSLRRFSAWAAAAAFVFNIHWIVIFGSQRSELAIGYFLWWISFLLLAIGLFLSRDT
jgi:hypothetical protein